MLKLDGVEVLIFDLGGVIIDIDFQLTFDQFAMLSGKSTDEIKNLVLDSGLLLQYEIGQCSATQFLNSIRSSLELSCSDDAIEHAFLALLLHIPAQRIALLRSLAKHYRLFLLSNTNAMHYEEVNAILQRDAGCEHLEQLFETLFLSFEMGLAKPGTEIYEAVVKAIGVKPEAILFLDDNEANLAGASSVGIQTALVSVEQSIISLFKYE